MKTTLAEYILAEKDDILKQQELLENAGKFLKELDNFYNNDIDTEVSCLQLFTIVIIIFCIIFEFCKLLL